MGDEPQNDYLFLVHYQQIPINQINHTMNDHQQIKYMNAYSHNSILFHCSGEVFTSRLILILFFDSILKYIAATEASLPTSR